MYEHCQIDAIGTDREVTLYCALYCALCCDCYLRVKLITVALKSL